MSVDVLYIRPQGSGWGPVSELARLSARLLGGRLLEVDDRGTVSLVQRTMVFLPRGRRGPGRHLLIIAGNPAALALAAHRRLWAPGYESVAAWTIDSFWTDRIAGIAQRRPHFDRLFITDPDLTDEWSSLTGRPVGVLPWGSDTLAFEPADRPRPVDLLRLGRQPAAWDDDTVTAGEAAERALVFRGRPPASEDSAVNQMNVRAALARTKIVLAFSNLVSPAAYTHPTRDYLTARWTDALSAGCLVAGVAPHTTDRLLWPGATIEISPTSREESWAALSAAADAWTVDRSAEQQRRARQTLDWRHRLRDLCVSMGWPTTAALDADLLALA